MAYEAVVVFGRIQLAKSKPFQTERQHAAPGLIDAAFLLMLDGFAAGPMAMHVEDRRQFA